MPDDLTSLAVIRAREAYRIAGWFPLTVLELHTLLERSDTRLVRSSRDAKIAVVDALDEMAGWLAGETPQSFALWDIGKDFACPKDENRISDWYCHGLRLLLARSGLIINREVEVVNVTGRGVGAETTSVWKSGIQTAETRTLSLSRSKESGIKRSRPVSRLNSRMSISLVQD